MKYCTCKSQNDNATDSPSITINHENVGGIDSTAKAFDVGLFDNELFPLLVDISRLRKNKRALLVTTEVGLDGPRLSLLELLEVSDRVNTTTTRI